MIRISRPDLAVLLCACLLPSAAFAQGVVRPMPEPDLSALPERQREMLAEVRTEFEKSRSQLVGVYLAEGFAKLSGFYARYGVFPAAYAAIDNAIAVAPEDGRFVYLKGFYLLREGRPAEARDQFTAALALDQQYLPIRIRLAATEIDLGNLAAAKAVLEPVIKEKPDFAPAAALLADIAMREQRWKDAIVLLRAALKGDPAATALYSPLAEALASSGDRQGAAAAREQAGPGLPRLADPLADGVFGTSAGTVEETALALASAGRHDDAITLITEALAQAPGNAGLLAVRARIEADRGQLQAARATIAEAKSQAADNPAVLFAEGLVSEIGGDAGAAERAYTAALTGSPEFAEARIARGLLHQRAGRPAKAFDDFRLAGQSVGAEGWQHAAAAAALANRCADVMQDLAAARKANPRDGGIAQVQARVVASCDAATDADRRAALTSAQRLYGLSPHAAHAETLAMVHAALGQFDDAIDYQIQAGVDLLMSRGEAAALVRKPFVEAFEGKRAVTTPWPPADPLMAPPAMSARPTEQASN